jgi:hypothetical protein
MLLHEESDLDCVYSYLHEESDLDYMYSYISLE